MKNCPFCNAVNKDTMTKCRCGYFFDKEAYENKLDKENKIAEKAYEQSEDVEVKISRWIIRQGYIGGIVSISIGVLLLVSGFRMGAYKGIYIALGFFAIGIISIGVKIQDSYYRKKNNPELVKKIHEHQKKIV